jgi:hypothetical protein
MQNQQIPLTTDNLVYLVETYRNDPRGFIVDVLCIRKLDEWQEQLLQWIKEGETRIAIASCNGSGKTFITSAIELWWLVTHPSATISVCSATYAQLIEVHMRELRSHIKNSLIVDYYDTCAIDRIRLPGSGDEAFISAVSNNKTRPEGIAGRHHGSLLTIFDEASGISPEIYMSQEGNMSTDGAVWICIGNPISSGTAFHEIFKTDLRWRTMHIDARKCLYTDKLWVQGMIDSYGLDDDRVRARILGEFPRGSVNSCVAEFDYDEAEKRGQKADEGTAIVIGLDVATARGKDSTVISARKGLELIDVREIVHTDNIDLADQAEAYFKRYNARVICIDYTGGFGAGPGDILARVLPVGSVREIQFAGRSTDPTRWINKRAELWAKYGEWIKKASIPKLRELKSDSCGLEYWINAKGQYQVEGKDDYQHRTRKGSPDWGDSVCCSLYVDIESANRPKASAENVIARMRAVSGGSCWV